MIRKFLLFLCILFVNLISQAQTTVVIGKIFNLNYPLENANVYLDGSTKTSLSDSLGRFSISETNKGLHKLTVKSIGYISLDTTFTTTSTDDTLILYLELKEKIILLDEVVISGTMKEVSKSESPVPVEVYNAAFFKANPTPSIFESLQNVNGVRPQLNCNVCNTGDIHINGLEGPYTMILIDGMPIVSGLSTVYGLTGIPQSLIERVEIVKGPASTLYGSEAVGGLVNIITKNPINAPVFSADVFSSNWRDINTDIGIKFNTAKKLHSLLGLNYFNYQNPIDNNKDGFTDITLQNRLSVFNKWTIDRKESRVFSIAGRVVLEDRWGGEMNWRQNFRGGDSIYAESIYTNRWETFGIYQLPVKEKIMFQFSANGHSQNSVYGTTAYIADQKIAFGQLTWNKTLSENHDILLGTSFRYTQYDDNTPATESVDKNNIKATKASKIMLPGVFVQDEIALNKLNKVLLGIRYDYNSIHGSVLTPRANYKFTSKNKKNIVRFGIGNGYRVANVFTEDHAALTGARKVEFVGDLKPETSWNGNVNYVKKMNLNDIAIITLDASAFYTYFNNRIVPDYNADANKIIYANLVGFAVSKGVSLNLDTQFNNGLSLLLGSTFMDVSLTNKGIKTRQLLTEKFSGVWNIGYTFNKYSITIDYTGNIYGSMDLPLLGPLDNRQSTSPTWSLQNMQCTKVLSFGLEIYTGIKNLLNFTPPQNSIARSFDPFDKKVDFDTNGNVIASSSNPNALSFDPSYVFAPNQGRRVYLGIRYTIK